MQTENGDIQEIKSALNVNDLIQFMKEECNSLEEEKRFLITQCIALVVSIVILIWALIELFIDQILYDLGSIDGNLFGIKVVYASLIIAFSFQLYRIISSIYAIILHDNIMRIIKAPSDKMKYVNIIPVFTIFLIISFHRFCPWISSIPSLPLEILKSFGYTFLLLIIGFDVVMSFLAVFLMEKYSKKIKYSHPSNKNVSISLFISIIYQFFILIVFIWILGNLEQPPVELLSIQLKFGLIFISIFFVLVYWAKPLNFRLKEITMKIEQLDDLNDKALSGKLSVNEIVLQRLNYKNIQ